MLEVSFRENLPEITATLLGVVVLSIGLSLGQFHGWPGIAGSILGITGASLSAIASSWTFARAASRKQLHAELEILRGQLATSTAQINQSVNIGRENTVPPEVPFARIDQAVSTISTVIRELGNITGSELKAEKESVIEAKKVLADIGKGLEILAEQTEEVGQSGTSMETQGLIDKFREEISESLKKLQDNQPRLDRDRVVERIKCPNCDENLSISIGKHAGDTSSQICPACQAKFNAHRGSQGVFTRIIPVMERTRRSEVIQCPVCPETFSLEIGSLLGDTTYSTCPHCATRMIVNRTKEGVKVGRVFSSKDFKCPACESNIPFGSNSTSAERFCLGCGSKSLLNVVDGTATLISEKEIVLADKIDTYNVQCPACKEVMSTFARRNDFIFAQCEVCDVLLRADLY